MSARIFLGRSDAKRRATLSGPLAFRLLGSGPPAEVNSKGRSIAVTRRRRQLSSASGEPALRRPSRGGVSCDDEAMTRQLRKLRSGSGRSDGCAALQTERSKRVSEDRPTTRERIDRLIAQVNATLSRDHDHPGPFYTNRRRRRQGVVGAPQFDYSAEMDVPKQRRRQR